MVSNQEKVMIIRKKKCCKPRKKSRFAKKSQKISTHLLTVLIIGAIVQLEQRKREIKEKDSDPKVQEHNIFDNQKC